MILLRKFFILKFSNKKFNSNTPAETTREGCPSSKVSFVTLIMALQTTTLLFITRLFANEFYIDDQIVVCPRFIVCLTCSVWGSLT